MYLVNNKYKYNGRHKHDRDSNAQPKVTID